MICQGGKEYAPALWMALDCVSPGGLWLLGSCFSDQPNGVNAAAHARRTSTCSTAWGVARPFRHRYPLAFGTTVTDHVADDDQSCGGAYPYRCRYFRVAVPHDGVLVVTIRWNFPASYPFDLGVYSPIGPVADGQIGIGLERTARGRVIGGTTYLIEVWSFLTPSGSFDLSTSIEPR